MTSRTPRRKLLTANYKKQAKKMGAYCIRNTRNQKCLVGTSRDIDARLNRHRFSLKTNTETASAELQHDWNQLGEEAFEFSVLDIIEPPDDPTYDATEDLAVLATLWLEQLQPFVPDGYMPRP